MAMPATGFRPNGQGARMQLALGEPGIRISLEEVAKRVVEGRLDPRVRAWAIRKLKEAGNPKTNLGRAEALLKALRDQCIWVPDPVHSEYMAKPHLTLGDGADLSYFAGGDCDDLTIALLAAYLSVIEAVGVQAAVVGHSYVTSRDITHVLGAVYANGKWYYVDPSTDYPFGKCKTPFYRERVIEVPSMKMTCDRDFCLSGPGAMKSPPSNTQMGVFVGVDGIPSDSEREPVHSPEVSVFGLGDPSLDTEFGQNLLGLSKYLQDAWIRFQDTYQRLQRVSSDLGVPVVDGMWTPEVEHVLRTLRLAVDAGSRFLVEAAVGQRPVGKNDSGTDFVIQGNPSDPFWIRSENGVIRLVSPNGEDFQGTGTLGTPVVVSSVPASAATVGDLYTVKAMVDAGTTMAESVLRHRIQNQFVDCTVPGRCTPAQQQQLATAFQESTAAMVDAPVMAEPAQSPWLTALQWTLISTTLITGVYGTYKILQELSGNGKEAA